jgi:hypothetical protein
MSPKPRHAWIALGVVAMLAAGILIGHGIYGKEREADARPAGPAPAIRHASAESGSTDPARDRLRRRPPSSPGSDDDRLDAKWGEDDDAQGGQEQQISTPVDPSRRPESGRRPRRSGGRTDGPEAGSRKPKPESRGGAADALDA